MPVEAGATAVGIAHCAFAERLVIEQPGIVDYVEIPFEQLVHNPRSAELAAHVPLILHCASLSMAGNVSPDRQLVESVHHWVRETKTPWIGEHLSYVRADGTWKEIAEHSALFMGGADQGPAGPFNVGYTVSPQYSNPVLDRVHEAWASFEREFGIPILLENGPIYFNMPGSTMSQSTFVNRLCEKSQKVGLLLDIAHLVITSENSGRDPYSLLDEFPLERVVEVHLSGTRREADFCWDDHSDRAPEIVFLLLERSLRRCRPRAITLEYNWDAAFPRDILFQDVQRVRGILASCFNAS
jgi:uncharacterized protein